MQETRRFAFDAAVFASAVAHAGRGAIHSARVVERSGTTGCRFVDLAVVPAGTSIGRHTHGADDEEIYVVVEGTGHMVVDGAEFPVGPGDVVVNRPGGTHELHNDGPLSLRLVVIDIGASAADA